jgi:hypothetical protein
LQGEIPHGDTPTDSQYKRQPRECGSEEENVSSDKYAGSEHIREHPAYREGYDRGYRNGYMEAMRRTADNLIPMLANIISRPIYIPIEDIPGDVLAKMTVTPDPQEPPS